MISNLIFTPNPPPSDPEYSDVSRAEGRISYTTVKMSEYKCGACRNMAQRHEIQYKATDGTIIVVGEVLGCGTCDRESWMFTHHGPHTREARRLAAKVVL